MKQCNEKPEIIEDLGFIFPNEKSKQRRSLLKVKCPICDNVFRVSKYDYNKGRVTKCKSCAQRIAATTHGKSRHRLFKIHSDIIQRCENENNTRYKYYGGRGISICDEWHNNPLAFYEWAIKNGYDKTLTIDRINNNGNYEPSNCRWTTKEVQSRNTRIYSTNKSGYRGVSYRKDSKTFRAYITAGDGKIHLGHHKNKDVCALVYNGFIVKNKFEHTPNKITASRISELRQEGYPIEDYTPKGEQYKIYFLPASYLKQYHSQKEVA